MYLQKPNVHHFIYDILQGEIGGEIMNLESQKSNVIREQKYSVLLWHRIVRMYKNNTKATNNMLTELELSNAQFDVISRVAESSRLSQQELADKLLVTKGNVTQILKKLEMLGFIKREREWKTNYLTLTDKGRDLYEQITPSLWEFQLDYFSNLSLEEKKQLLTLLQKAEKRND